MNGFSIGTIFRDNCNTLVIVSGSTVFDLEKLLAASGADSLPSGFGLSEMLDDCATWFPRIKQAVEPGESQGSGGIDTYRIADVSEFTWRAPILKPRKLICMGTNYADVRRRSRAIRSKPRTPLSNQAATRCADRVPRLRCWMLPT
jgi:2-keto-4-pentenoate hydratase/2-oxohepta-3-ene-1,7-dioic acid hydratase in catechol pathway